jgi:DNA topoisomerase VI subunit B
MEKCVLDRQHRLRKQRLRKKYTCTYVQSIAETAKQITNNSRSNQQQRE